MTAPGGHGGDDALREHWARMRAALTDMERRVASELGDEAATAQAREYIEHNEPALALELLVCIAMRAGLHPAALDARVEDAAALMGLADSEPLAEWRRYRGGRTEG
ncbi:hypothetical protein GCM10009416_04360 [Craurococcus roseus]|uniref:Uncharacterized protein n=1 Tax=Craurococcus roseus TaxID=77585 RepID=A0ABP3PPU7_9PROT